MKESFRIDAGHRVGDGDGGQTAATKESPESDAGHRVGDGDGGQTAAIIEGIVADAGHCVGGAIVDDAVGNDEGTSGIGGIVRVATILTRHLGIAVHNIVVQRLTAGSDGREVVSPHTLRNG